MELRRLNKKGSDIPSAMFAVIMIFIVGVFLFFYVKLSGNIYDSFDNYFTSNSDFNATEAHTSIENIRDVEHSFWDYGFLAIVFGIILSLFITAYSTRIHPIFFWVYGIVSFVIMCIAVIVSNTWQQLAASPEFADTLTAFPITNAILGNNYPLFIFGVLVIGMILLFGKNPSEDIR